MRWLACCSPWFKPDEPPEEPPPCHEPHGASYVVGMCRDDVSKLQHAKVTENPDGPEQLAHLLNMIIAVLGAQYAAVAQCAAAGGSLEKGKQQQDLEIIASAAAAAAREPMMADSVVKDVLLELVSASPARSGATPRLITRPEEKVLAAVVPLPSLCGMSLSVLFNEPSSSMLAPGAELGVYRFLSALGGLAQRLVAPAGPAAPPGISSQLPVLPPTSPHQAAQSASLIIDTCLPGWPILYCCDTWMLWSGLKRQETLGRPLQLLLQNPQQSSSRMRWSQLELSALERESFVLCDAVISAASAADTVHPVGPVSTLSLNTRWSRSCTDPGGVSSSLLDASRPTASTSDTAAWAPAHHLIHSHDLAEHITSSQEHNSESNAADASRAHSVAYIRQITTYPCSQADAGSSVCNATTWPKPESRLDLAFHPLALAGLDDLARVSSIKEIRNGWRPNLAGLYIVNVLLPGTWPRPVDPLLPAIQVDTGSHITLGGMAACFWPGIKLTRELGSGRFGTAWYGVWHEVEVVVKVQDVVLHSTRDLEAAQQEVALGQQLDHPNIARTLSHATVQWTGRALSSSSVASLEPIQFLAIDTSAPVAQVGTRLTKRSKAQWADDAVPVDDNRKQSAGASDQPPPSFPMTLSSLQLMELCNAGTLQDCLDRGWLGLPGTPWHRRLVLASRATAVNAPAGFKPQQVQGALKVLLVLQDVCKALCHLHSLGIVHADLSATNVLMCTCGARLPYDQDSLDLEEVLFGDAASGTASLSSGGGGGGGASLPHPWLVAKVSDLGAAKKLGNAVQLIVPCCGTPNYMAPETMLHQVVSAATDVFALGSLIYQICHQRVPWRGLSGTDIYNKNAAGQQLEWTAHIWPPGLAAVGQRCCAHNPRNRPTAMEVLQDLQGLAAEASCTCARAT